MGQKPKPEDFLEDGHNCLADGRYQEAISAFEKALETAQTEEDRAEACVGWGNALLRLGRYDEAIEKYKKAIQIEEDSVTAYVGLGSALFSLERHDEAIENYKKATQIEEEYPAAYVGWGNALFGLKRYDEAIEKCEKAIQIEEEYPTAYVCLGNALALSSRKRYDEAIEKYEKAIQIKKDCAEAYVGWGNVLARLQRYDEAIEKYEKATQIKKGYSLAYRNWSLALEKLERYDEALEKLENAASTKEDLAKAYLKWGNALFRFKRYDEAIEKYEKATQIKENYAAAYLHWATALVNLKLYDEAIEKCEKTSQIDPYHPYPMHIMANLFAVRGMYEEAWERWESALYVYRRAHKKQTDLSLTADFCQNYGNVLRAGFERLEEAENIYKEGLKLDPTLTGILAGLVELYLVKAKKDPVCRARHYWNARESCSKAAKQLTDQLQKSEDPDTRFQLGQLFLSIGRYHDAEIHLLKAIEQDKERSEIYNSLGVVHNHKGDFQEAARYFREARLMEPDDLTAWTNLAETYLRLNLKDKAEVAYKGILRIAPGNVEAHIGLGEVYLAMESDDEEIYDRAIRCFSKALEMADSTRGSKKLERKDRAVVIYSRAFARVMFYEKAPINMTDERQLRVAWNDFKDCFELDPECYKAERARDRLAKQFSYSSLRWFGNKVAPWMVSVLSVAIFILSQWKFYLAATDKLGAAYYTLLTFGSLIFMVAGPYLPQILKIKVGGIELEKKPSEQITTSVGLGITWEKKTFEQTAAFDSSGITG